MDRLHVLVVASLVLTACSGRSTSASETESNETETSETATETETGAPPDLPSEAPEVCGECDDTQLCVASCIFPGPGFPGEAGPSPKEFRCIEPGPCGADPNTPECREHACGTPFHQLEAACGDPEVVAAIDVLCSEFSSAECDLLVQDCPAGEKCVPHPVPGFEPGLYPPICRPVEGDAVHGEACTASANAFDDCDAASMCWTEELVLDGFAGTCRAFCDLDADPVCPDGGECEVFNPWFQLCTTP